MTWMEVAWHGLNIVMILGLVVLFVRLITIFVIASK